MRAPVECSKVGGAPRPPTGPRTKQAEPSAEQEDLRPGWNHVVCGGRVIKAATPPSHNPSPGPVTENPTRNEVATTRKKGKTAKSAPEDTVGPK